MKKVNFKIFFTLVLPFLLISCYYDNLADRPIYWNSNTLTRLQLKDSVKSMSYFNDSVSESYEFNSNGFITSHIRTDNHNTTTELYNYEDNGRLKSVEYRSIGTQTCTDITSFEYITTGKYILRKSTEFFSEALVPNLLSESNSTCRIVYQDNKASVKIIESKNNKKDSLIVYYVGYYPVKVKLSNGTVYSDISYDSYGKFTAYTINYNSDNCSVKKCYYFKPDNQYLLLDSIVQTHITVDSVVIRDCKESFIYNTMKDVTSHSTTNGNFCYSYTYDSHKNWIKKTTEYRLTDSENWELVSEERREIIYW